MDHLVLLALIPLVVTALFIGGVLYALAAVLIYASAAPGRADAGGPQTSERAGR